jgi:hypothetical protein
MTVGILPGDMQISVGEDGAIASKLIVSTAYNVLPIWLRVASDQLHQAKSANDALKQSWGDNDASNRELLISELEPSLQVFVACGIALDCLYDQLKPHAKLAPVTIDAWKQNRTGRAKQILEVIRRVYRLDNTNTKGFGMHIEEIIQFRDRAVHPSLDLQRTCTRPDVPVGVDWKFAAYRFTNSQICFEATMRMLIHLYEKASGIVELDAQFDTIFEALEELKLISRKSNDMDPDENDA